MQKMFACVLSLNSMLGSNNTEEEEGGGGGTGLLEALDGKLDADGHLGWYYSV